MHHSRFAPIQSYAPAILSALLLSMASFSALASTNSANSANAANAANVQTVLGNDDDTFVFMGRCPNGEMYRLKAYQQLIDGNLQSFYDYEGPAGKGTVQTKTSPKVMVARLCLALAEIRSDF